MAGEPAVTDGLCKDQRLRLYEPRVLLYLDCVYSLGVRSGNIVAAGADNDVLIAVLCES